jgi:hypothetical protein
MDPADAPPDSLRGRLMHHMTSLDSQLKRCVAEFLFLLCGEDGESLRCHRLTSLSLIYSFPSNINSYGVYRSDRVWKCGGPAPD